jgi:acetyl-CoA carboxylase biotin carboxyl carrier protein|tara:strand:- start:577 stop:1020 length:444 start_codon:yes stop_codon:yes gene_type:complete
MDIRKIKTLIEMLEESNLKEIEVSQGDESVRISKQSKSTNIVENDQSTINQIDTGNAIHDLNQNKDIIHKGKEVKSPIVGTFYRKPNPESEPFINVGDLVKKGDVLCIIEAMKMMNEIKSDYDGKIISIEINDEQPVEFGQTIIVIQ